jgi:hypothetical protein
MPDERRMGQDMQDDPPTMPGWHAADAFQRPPGGAPTWPTIPGPPAVPTSPVRDRQPVLLIMSLVANGALLACVLMLIVLARAGVLTPPSASGQTGPLAAATNSAMATPIATPSPTSESGWLQVAPATVQLGCGEGQQTQYVVLRNTGTDSVQWQVGFAGTDQVGVSVNTSGGDLRAGASIALQIQIRRHASDQQGVIRFSPDTPAAGSPASLSYTITGCQ